MERNETRGNEIKCWIAATHHRRDLFHKWIDEVASSSINTGSAHFHTHSYEGSIVCAISSRPTMAREVHVDWNEIQFRFRQDNANTGGYSDIVTGSLEEISELLTRERPSIELSRCVINPGGALYIITGHYGLKSAYVCRVGDGYAVSSDLHLLLCHPEVSIEIDYSVCRELLGSSCSLGEQLISDGNSFFVGVSQISAGVVAEISQSIRQKKWWGPEMVSRSKADPNSFREIFTQAVHDQCEMHRGNIRVELSGGIDSASVLAAAACVCPKERLSAVTMAFNDVDLSESHDCEMASEICLHLEVDLTVLNIDDTLRFPQLYHDDIIHLNGPDPRANPLACDLLNRKAIESDIGVVLCGEAADGLIEGNSFFIADLLRRNRWRDAIRACRKSTTGEFSLKRLFQFGICPLIPLVPEHVYRKIAWGDIDIEPPCYINPTFSTKYAAQARNRRGREPDWNRKYIKDFFWPRARYVSTLSSYVNRSSPFMDRRVMEFGLCVDAVDQVDMGAISQGAYRMKKFIQREAFKDILPKCITNRETKTTYAMMARKRLVNSAKSLFRRFDTNQRLIVSELGFVKPKPFLERLTAEIILAEDKQCDLSMHYQFVEQIINLELWLQCMELPKSKILQRSGIGEHLQCNKPKL